MKPNKVLKVGLTGGIGTGKSTVSSILSKDYGIKVIDADLIARRVLSVHPEILSKIREVFGGDFFDNDGNFIRRKMGNLIFSDMKKKKEYEEIILPYIKKDIYDKIEEYDIKKEKICIVDAPTLIETGIYKDMDKVVVVNTRRDIQIKRIMARDNFSMEDAIKRIENQMSTEDKCRYADYIIYNNDDINNTREQIKEILTILQGL